VALFAVLGFPFAIILSVPNSMTMELIAESGGGQGLAIGILNLAIVIPQMIITLGAGPWDAWFGGGNEPAFVLAALFGFGAAVVAVWKLPKMSGTMHTRRMCNEWAALI
jgi:solute carrier family 45 protein 1/2/4